MRVYELRRYTLFPGTMARMLTRFQTLNTPVFEEHGIHVEHAWRDLDNSDSFLFLASFTSREDRETAWTAYHQDQRYLTAKEDQATIIQTIEIRLLEPTDGNPQ